MALTVGIIDDDPQIVTLIGRFFGSRDCNVVAISENDAVNQLRTVSPNVVLLDLLLEKRSGFDLLSEIRSSHITTPIIVLTGSCCTEEKIRVLNAGADDYVTKPVEMRELEARFRAVLRRTQPPVLDYGDEYLQIIVAENRVVVDGKEKSLSGREWQLLVALLSVTGPHSREALARCLWGKEHEFSLRAVDRGVVRIRQAIEKTPKHPRYIMSCRGFGYEFKRH